MFLQTVAAILLVQIRDTFCATFSCCIRELIEIFETLCSYNENRITTTSTTTKNNCTMETIANTTVESNVTTVTGSGKLNKKFN